MNDKNKNRQATPGGVDVGFAFDVGLREKLLTQPTCCTLQQADETTSHSTRLPKNASQVAGYQGERL